MKNTKLFYVTVKDESKVGVYDFYLPFGIDIDDIAKSIANAYKVSLPEGRTECITDENQMTFAFCG
jgi:hypothetical protein